MLKQTGGILLPKTHQKYQAVRIDLDRVIYGWDNNITKIKFFEEYNDSILIPRFYPINDNIEDKTEIGEDIEIESNIIPRTNRQRKAIDFMIKNTNGILQLEPGSGKTVITIDVISKIKKRAIIITHKDKLLKNWQDEFLLHTNLKPDDIGRLTSQNYKKILDKKIILCTPHVIAIAVDRDKKEFLNFLQNAKIGILIIDECHVGVGPEKFSKSSLHLPCKRVYGLSATPTRTDGNDDIIRYHLGEISYFPPDENEIIKPKIYMIFFPFGVYSRYQKYLNWDGKFQLGRYQKQMFKVETYIDIVSKMIKKLYNDGRTSLILGVRTNCLLQLARKSGVPKSDIGIFIPGATSEERLSVSDTDDLDVAFTSKKLVFGTYMGCRDGNNRKDLDCLIMTTPTTNIEQAIGRIQRELVGKKDPIVIDLVDTEGPPVYSSKSTKENKEKTKWFLRSAEKRIEEYKKFEWEVKVINLDVKIPTKGERN